MTNIVTFLLGTGVTKGCLLSTFLLSIVLNFLICSGDKKKTQKDTKMRGGKKFLQWGHANLIIVPISVYMLPNQSILHNYHPHNPKELTYRSHI